LDRLEATHDDRTVTREILYATVIRKPERVRPIDGHIHDHGFQEHLTPLLIQLLDYCAELREVVTRRRDDQRVRRLVSGDANLAFENLRNLLRTLGVLAAPGLEH